VRRIYLSLILCCGIAAGCAGNQAAIQVQHGRSALLTGDPAAALALFNQAARENPAYVNDATPLRQGVLTYVGKTEYQLGNLAEARSALTESLKRDQNDFMARLYLGLTLLRLPPVPAKTDKSFSVADITFALKEQWKDNSRRLSPSRSG
jgi:tetratricopeptide (TPR) repeat protein